MDFKFLSVPVSITLNAIIWENLNMFLTCIISLLTIIYLITVIAQKWSGKKTHKSENTRRIRHDER